MKISIEKQLVLIPVVTGSAAIMKTDEEDIYCGLSGTTLWCPRDNDSQKWLLVQHIALHLFTKRETPFLKTVQLCLALIGCIAENDYDELESIGWEVMS